MEQEKYLIRPVATESGATYKWRASYKKKDESTRSLITITDVGAYFDTEVEAAVYTRELLRKEGVRDEEIAKG